MYVCKGDGPEHVLYNVSPRQREQRKALKAKLKHSSEQTLQTKHLMKTSPHLKNILWREAIRKTFRNNTLTELKFRERSQALLQRNKPRNESYPYPL